MSTRKARILIRASTPVRALLTATMGMCVWGIYAQNVATESLSQMKAIQDAAKTVSGLSANELLALVALACVLALLWTIRLRDLAVTALTTQVAANTSQLHANTIAVQDMTATAAGCKEKKP